jgi:protein-S-isoprenylcysteine O-methyltransferase Ste14
VIWAVFAWHVAARVAYVGFVWVALRLQQQRRAWTRRWGIEAGFRRFRRVASLLMTHDAVSFIALCLVGRNTLPLIVPRGVAMATGVLLCVVGLAVKTWAAATLGGKAYYWYDFFTSTRRVAPAVSGPYRFLDDPMYTVGYLHAYGFALFTGSLAGIAASFIDQAAILVFHRSVEKVHFARVRRAA